VVQFKFLPPHLQQKFRSPRGDSSSSSQDSGDEEAKEDDDAVRYFLVSPTASIAHADLLQALRQSPPFSTRTSPPRIFYVTMPALAPTSAEQAQAWTEKYWPIAYKNTNPFGPHPSLVQRNAAEIEPSAGQWLTMAQEAGRKTCEMGFGEPVGCVVVDNSREQKEVVAVAGDCRWRSSNGEAEEKQGCGNVMAHAVQRAIAIVAKKRLTAAGKDPDILDRKPFCDSPLTHLERTHYERDNIVSSGYLCVDLDIYITHEPCVMCSMAILHSRFKRCIFGRRMPKTGGLTADTVDGKVDVGLELNGGQGLGHGIFWRPSELNWKLLAWEFQDEDQETKSDMATDSISDTLQA
jgi:tRNA-specific adenosine deaminase 3